MKVDNQKVCIADDNQEQKGSHFLVGVEYVDYLSPEDGEKATAITQNLLDKKFVKFDHEVRV